MQLDRTRKPAAVVNHPQAKYYQDGHYFNGAGELLRVVGPGQEGEVEFAVADAEHLAMVAEAGGEESGVPTAAELALRAENQQLRERLEALEKAVMGAEPGGQRIGTAPPKSTTHDGTDGSSKDVTPTEPPQDPQPTQPPPTEPQSMKEQLEAMPAAKLKKLVLDNGGPEDITSGTGAKARMVEWLLANVK